jgi:hypothetical protein
MKELTKPSLANDAMISSSIIFGLLLLTQAMLTRIAWAKDHRFLSKDNRPSPGE